MKPIRREPRRALAAAGVLVVLLQFVATGDRLHGYGKLGGAFLLHAGLLAVLVALTATAADRLSLSQSRRNLAVTIAAIAALYPLAVGLMWYDLVLTPPSPRYAPPTLPEIARDRLEIVLLFGPLAAGYAVGGVDTDAPGREYLTVAVAPLLCCGPVVAAWLAIAGGAHPGFTGGIYAGAWFVTLLAGVPFFLVARHDRKQEL